MTGEDRISTANWITLGLVAFVVGRLFWLRRGVVSLSARDVQGLTEAGEKLVFVDVREVDELRSGRIPGAISVPLSRLESLVKNLDPNVKTILVCATGNRSITAFQRLKAKGFTNLINMTGGMSAWSGATTTKR